MSAVPASYRLGIAFLIGSILLISTSDAVAKHLTTRLPVMQIALVQAICTTLVALVLARRRRELLAVARTSRPGLQAARAGCHLVSAVCFFLGIKYLPLADVVAIIFIGPLLITALAALVLGESVGPRRWAACAAGLVGAMVVVRPGLDGLGWPAVYPVVSVTMYTIYVICTRRLAPTERPATMLFYSGIGALAVLAVASPLYWTAPAIPDWAGLVAVGLISTASTVLSIRAYALAPASLLAPYAYVEIVSATFYGYAIFGDVPDAFTVVGAGLIVASGLYVYHREKTLA